MATEETPNARDRGRSLASGLANLSCDPGAPQGRPSSPRGLGRYPGSTYPWHLPLLQAARYLQPGERDIRVLDQQEVWVSANTHIWPIRALADRHLVNVCGALRSSASEVLTAFHRGCASGVISGRQEEAPPPTVDWEAAAWWIDELPLAEALQAELDSRHIRWLDCEFIDNTPQTVCRTEAFLETASAMCIQWRALTALMDPAGLGLPAQITPRRLRDPSSAPGDADLLILGTRHVDAPMQSAVDDVMGAGAVEVTTARDYHARPVEEVLTHSVQLRPGF